MAGRRTVLTPELEADLLRYLRLGNFISTACSAVGVHRDTFYGWMERGRASDEAPYGAFRARVHEALAEAEIRDLATIQKASLESWQAAAWRLERRFHKRWGRRLEQKAEITTKEIKLPHNLDLLSPGEARLYLRALAKMAGDGDTRMRLEAAAEALEGA